MEDKDIQLKDTFELPVQQGSGSILAVERKKQNKTAQEIASELNLSVSQIRTIELDQTDGLPEPTYVRGYIRSYANLLGLDPDQVLKNYLNPNWQKSSRLDEMPRGIGSAEERPSNGGSKSRLFGVLLLLAAIGGFLWYSGYLDSLIGSDSSLGIVTTPVASTEPASDNLVNTADVDLTASVATEQFDEIAVDTNEEPLQANAESELVLTFTQTSWVDIRDSADNRLAYKSYVTGEELIVSNEGPMSVFIGNAEGVAIQYNGAVLDIEQYREGVYAKFVVNDD